MSESLRNLATSPDAATAARIRAQGRTLSAVTRSTTTAAIGAGAPTYDAQEGEMYFDLPGTTLYVHAGDVWHAINP